MTEYTFKEVVEASKEYFNGDELAAEVFTNKYALKNTEGVYFEKTPADMHKRLSKEFSRIEKKFPNPLSQKEIFGLFERFKYVIPQGSPMFGIGNKSQKVSLSNCFVVDCVDSYGGICNADERIAQISKRRGGVGIDISPIRPKGLPTNNSSLTTDGITLFMERFSRTIREVGQSGRRGALMISISIHHPEVMSFIHIKRDLEKVTGANISVRMSDEFMKAVKGNKKYEQRWPVDSKDPKISQKVNAREIWDELIKSNYLGAEPGMLFWDTIINNSPADSYASLGFKTTSTNPCSTGDTLVYVADGRGDIPIKQLADEGKDIPVFCYDDKGKIVVRTMRHPRLTGHNELIYKITLDDGSIVRTTGNHKFLNTDGEYKRVDEIKKGESLKILTKYEASIKDIFPKANSNSQDYLWLNDGKKTSLSEHRIIASSKYGEIEQGNVIHHKDFNAKNNSPDNLISMSKKAHDKYHGDNMRGDKNPMRRAKHEWSDEKWQEYHNTMSKAVSAEKNGRFSGFTNEEVREHAVLLTKEIGRRFSKREWQKYAKVNKLPIEFSNWRKDNLGTLYQLSKRVALECGFENINEDTRIIKTLTSMTEQGYNAKIENSIVIVERKCEECSTIFEVDHLHREVSFCSQTCVNNYLNKTGTNDKRTDTINQTYKNKANKTINDQLKIYTGLKFNSNREPLLKEWEKECKNNNISFRLKTKHGLKSYKELKERAETFNHRVVSVEIDGHEDVYNGTVDDFHNFFIGGFEGLTKTNKRKLLYINNLQCGELPIPDLDSCRLMCHNLSSYVVNPFTPEAYFDWDLFKKHVIMAQRLMDDLIELELDAVDGIIAKIKLDPEDERIKFNELSMWEGIRDKCEKGRRTGLGVTALGDTIAMLGHIYGDDKSVKVVDKIYSTLRNEAYRSSIQLAKERGAFPIFDAKLEKDNQYLNRLPDDIKKDMAKHGRRNIGLLTTAPAGSVSVVAQTSSGFEPVFKAVYFRKRKLMESESNEEADFIDKTGDKWKEYSVHHHGLKKFIEITGKTFEDSPYNGAEAGSIDHLMRVKMQATATKYVDHSISSTINLPNNIKLEVVNDLYMEAWKSGCKGLTIYRDGSRVGVLTSEKTKKQPEGKKCEDCKDASQQMLEEMEEGYRPPHITVASAPKRSGVLECDIHRSKVGGGEWLFFIGMLNKQPYEIFGGNSTEFSIPHKYKNGWIIKNGKVEGVTQYNLILGSLEDENEKLEFKGIAKHFNNYEYGAFTRLASLTIRHGVSIKYVCEQITKKGVEGDLFSFQRAMARVLKKYIGEGEESGLECPDCGSSDMVYKNGCPACMVCGFSHCS